MYLSFQPLGRQPFSSLFHDVPPNAAFELNPITVVSGQPLPDTIVIRFMSNTSADPLIQVDGSVTLASIVPNASNPILVGYSSATVIDGRLIIRQLTIESSDQTLGFLIFTMTNSLWIISPIFQVFQDISTFDLQLTLSPSSSIFISDPTDLASGFTVVSGVPIPSFTFVVRDASGTVTPAKDGFQIGCNVTQSYNGRIVATTGAEADINYGMATFNQMTISEDFVDGGNVDLQCFVESGGGGLGVSHVVISRIDVISNAFLGVGLGFSSNSFIQLGFADLSAVIGVPMPKIEVVVVDSASLIDLSAQQISVTASCLGATFAPAGSTAVVVGGIATFESLTFTYVTHSPANPLHQVVITFTAGYEVPSMVAAGSTLFSPLVNVSFEELNPAPVRIQLSSALGRFQRYSDEFLVVEGSAVDMIVVEITGRDNIVTPAAGGMLITMAVSPTQSLLSAVNGSTTVAASEGMATFRNVVFTGSFGPYLWVTFQSAVVGNSSIPLTPAVIQVQVMSTVIPAYGLQFAASSLSYIQSPRQVVAATLAVPMHSIVVEIVNSDGQLDVSANSVVVTAVSFFNNMQGATSVAYGGRAVFSSLTLPSAGTTNLVFTASCVEACAVSGKTLVSATFQVYPTLTPRCALAFANNSFITVQYKPLSLALNAVIPQVGIVVLDSSGSLDLSAAGSVVIVAAISSGRLNGTTSVPVDPITGIAWFTNLIVSSLAAPVGAHLVFTAMAASGPAVKSSIVVGKRIMTGLVQFQSASLPLALSVVPSFDSAGNALWLFDNATVPLNSSTFSTTVPVDASPRNFSVMVCGINGAGSYILPPNTVTRRDVMANSTTLSLGGATGTQFMLDTRPVLYPAIFPAVLSPMLVASPQLVRGYFDVIRIRTQAYAPATLEVELGPFAFATISDAEEPVVAAEVQLDAEQLLLGYWISAVASQLNVEQDRIEVVRTRPFGTSDAGTDLTAFGTRIELRFSSPSTSTSNRATSKQLATLFVGMSQSCTSVDLHISRKYFVADPVMVCDLWQLQEQWLAVQRCLDTTRQQCNCHLPLFEALAAACGSTAHFINICSGVTNCLSSTIRDGCDSYKSATYLAYAMTGVYALLFLLVVGLIYVYKKELLQKCMRDTLSNRMRRDVDYPGLKIQRLQTEHAEPLDLI